MMIVRRHGCRRTIISITGAILAVFALEGHSQAVTDSFSMGGRTTRFTLSDRFETVTFYEEHAADSRRVISRPSARPLTVPPNVGRALILPSLERFGVMIIELAPQVDRSAVLRIVADYNRQFPAYPRHLAVAGGERHTRSPNGNPIYSAGSVHNLLVNEVVVRFKRGTDRLVIGRTLGLFNAEVLRQPAVADRDSYLVRFPGMSGHGARDLSNRLDAQDVVEYSQPNFYFIDPQRLPGAGLAGGPKGCLLRCPDTMPPVQIGDRFLSKQWHLDNTGITGTEFADISARKAWAITPGNSNIVIAVLDDLVESGHEDLAGKICASGTVCAPSTAFPPGVPNAGLSLTDSDFHGTAAAGLAAAVTGNLRGVAGVAIKSRIMPVRTHADGVPSLQSIETGIKHAADHAQVLSMSWHLGWASSYPQGILEVERAIEYATLIKKRVLVFAAGNHDGLPGIEANYPANLTAKFPIIAVSATNEWDQLKVKEDLGDDCDWSSNIGVDTVAAPGVNLYTTDRMGDAGYCATGAHNNYTLFGGTSGATPLVAGTAALILAVDRSMTPLEVRTRLQLSAEHPAPEARPYDESGWGTGWGRINACRALQGRASCFRSP